MKHNICICCKIGLTSTSNKMFCNECDKFIHDKLELSSVTISRKLGMKIYSTPKHKCTFCDKNSIVSYKDYEYNKKYYICKSHLNRWLRIGCQVGDLANFLHLEPTKLK